MDMNGRLPSMQSDADLRNRQFREVSQELDAALWNLLTRPSVGSLDVLQLGATVELMPNVYIQAVRLMHKRPYDRYIRLWCVAPTNSGELEERTLLCFYTSGFPDPQFTQARLGMDMNLAWWDAVRMRLAEVASEIGLQAELQAELEETLSNGVPGLPHAEAKPQPPVRRATAPPAPDAHSTPPLHAPQAPQAPHPSHAPQDARRAEIFVTQATALFMEVKQARDAALLRRDEIDQQLTRRYFAAYPYMRQALRQLSEVDLGELVSKWAREGCPTPDARAAAQTPGANAESAASDAPAQTAETQRSSAAEGEDASALEGAWALALELESAQTLIRERTHLLEQLCELSGGHQPFQRRDGVTGRLQTVCERCDMSLFQRDPDRRDGWVN